MVQQQFGTLSTAAEAEVDTGAGTARRTGAAGELAAVGVTPLTESVLVAVFARRAFSYAVQAVLRIDTRVARPGTLQSNKTVPNHHHHNHHHHYNNNKNLGMGEALQYCAVWRGGVVVRTSDG